MVSSDLLFETKQTGRVCFEQSSFQVKKRGQCQIDLDKKRYASAKGSPKDAYV